MTVLPRFAPGVRALRIPRPGRGARGFVLGALVGVALVLAALVGFRHAFADRILPGVHVGGVDVGGLTRADARLALSSTLGRLEDGAIKVSSGTGWAVIPFALVGRAVEYDAMLDRAQGLGRDGTRFMEAIVGLRQVHHPVSIPPQVSFDRDRLADELAAFAERGYRAPSDAAIVNRKSGYLVTPSHEGVRVDTSRVEAAISAALVDPATQGSLSFTADATAVAPATTDADAARALAMAKQVATELVLAKGTKTWKITGSRIRSWITFGGTGSTYAPRIDPAGVPAALERVAKAVLVKPTEARYLHTRSGRLFGVSASGLGSGLNVDVTAKAVIAALDARAAGAVNAAPVKIATMKLVPELSTDEATRKAPLLDRVGSWTTHYPVSARNGFAANITIPARRLDGTVVAPGQTFEFWGALGEVSFRTGYRLGAAIVGGRTVEGRALAGGICSVSTTLFNAAARAGLDIVTRSPHWYYIDRYPLGLDATVSGSQSMRFRNDTKHPVLIKAYASPGVVTFEIWSVPNGRTTTWSRPSVRNVVRGYDTVRETASLPRGTRERIEYPVDGKHVTVTRTVRSAGGAVVHRDVFVSNYHRMVGVTLVGTR